MGNIIDYMEWRGDLTFKKSSFNEVDNLILSVLSYIEINNKKKSKRITVREAIDEYFEMYEEKDIFRKFSFAKEFIPFLKTLAASKRFGTLYISHYINKISKKEEKQFSAMMIHLNRNTIYLAFKGTDETIIGWKEDFNMSFMIKVPSQEEALNYVNHIIKFKHRHVYLGGHSKGGNLAVYAFVNCKKNIQKKIKCVFNNDGPGFLEEFTSSPAYLKCIPRIISFLPETSIVGMLFSHKSEYHVVKSSSTGIWQHNPLTWQVVNTSFVALSEVDETSTKIKKMITDWLQMVDSKKREIFINSLYKMLEENQVEKVEDLLKFRLRYMPKVLKNFNKLDEETRKIIMETLKELINEARKNFDRKTILHSIKNLNKR